MNLKISLASFLALIAISLVGYSLSLVGVPGTLVNSIWKVVALCFGLSIILGFAWPILRGVRKGDGLALTNSFVQQTAIGAVINVFGGVGAVALQNGRKGDKIRVQLQGRQAEAIVISYESTFSPAVVKVTEIEAATYTPHNHHM